MSIIDNTFSDEPQPEPPRPSYWTKYRVLQPLTPQQEHELLSDLDSMKGLGAVTYDTRTNRLIEFEVDSFSVWRIEMAKALVFGPNQMHIPAELDPEDGA